MTLGEILGVLRELAPEETALEDDPVGLLIGGDLTARVTKVGVCLDAMPDAAARAAAAGVQLLVAHHPLIYRPLKRIKPARRPGGRRGGDAGQGGRRAVRDAHQLGPGGGRHQRHAGGGAGIAERAPLGADGPAALPRLGDLASPRPLADFARLVETALGCAGTSALRVQ